MPEGDQKSVELLLKNILDILDKLEKKVAANDDKARLEFEALRKEIELVSVLLDHQELVEILGQNVSPEGMKSLISDVKENTDFRKKWASEMQRIEDNVTEGNTFRKKAESERKLIIRIIGWGITLGVPILGFLIWILQKYVFV